MAVFFIAEFERLWPEAGGAQLVGGTPLVEQTVAIGASSVQSAAVGPNTHVVRITTDAICSYAQGLNPTATAAKRRLSADAIEYIGVVPGEKLAVITNT